ncbi:tripartite tricarboxylate transporter substrate binding protein [uncultured Cohaesibacter sp.]|uniref:Bug family tripartite tricarboxylate transporter substrate binding protein n=1 Tax=uncultured Cohaesibacter sp. TaxID=1002546 RepID=UPI0029C787B6|nr:tripartite tricarboxylate transporter substrate binding protein [uncultured Cohaesibacter sp.]
MKTKFKTLLMGTMLIASATAAGAADYPSRPIQVIVPYSAGGGTDLSARIMADVFQKLYPDSTLIIRNQPGGGGSIGTSAAINAKADGYTLGTGSQGPLALLPHYGGTDYQVDDIAYIGLMGRNLQLVVGCANAPFSTGEEFLTYAKEHPGKVQVGNSGAGGANHIAVAAMSEAAGIEVEHVPFGGASQAVTACLGGHIHAMTLTPSEGLPHMQSGSITGLFIMEDERIKLLPDIPTLKELGVDFTWSSWKGIIAPKDVPEDVLGFLREAFQKVFNDPGFLDRMGEMGEFVEYRDAKGYEALVRRDSKTAGEVIEKLGMTNMNK